MRAAIPILISAAVVLALILAVILIPPMRAAVAQDKKMASAFVANPNNETSVSVRGWKRGELDRILVDFRRLYELRETSSWKIAAKSDDEFTFTFPNDIQPKLLYFLINYIKYPKDLDLTNRSIGVFGRVVLTAAFGVPDSVLIGKRAVIYVPANDTDYDLVYAKTKSNGAYKIPFTTLIWEPVEDARMPGAISVN